MDGMGQMTYGEWFDTSRLLAANGWLVLVPLFHSNEATKPGNVDPNDAVSAALAAVAQLSAAEGVLPLVLLGKSWGGIVATSCAAAHPGKVAKLVVVAPAVQEPLVKNVQCPVLMQWCR